MRTKHPPPKILGETDCAGSELKETLFDENAWTDLFPDVQRNAVWIGCRMKWTWTGCCFFDLWFWLRFMLSQLLPHVPSNCIQLYDLKLCFRRMSCCALTSLQCLPATTGEDPTVSHGKCPRCKFFGVLPGSCPVCLNPVVTPVSQAHGCKTATQLLNSNQAWKRDSVCPKEIVHAPKWKSSLLALYSKAALATWTSF